MGGRRDDAERYTSAGLVELAGIEPRSFVGSSLKLLSPTLAEGDNPPRMLPTKGAHPLRNPRSRIFIIILVELAGIEPATS
jgi:hypothetical protein